jgi:mRNA interferase YafQ
MKYEVVGTSAFKKELKIIKKRHIDLEKLRKVVNALSNGEQLEEKYRDHSLVDSTRFKNCRECHIEPDWLLVYRINNDELILLLVETGSHSDLF